MNSSVRKVAAWLLFSLGIMGAASAQMAARSQRRLVLEALDTDRDGKLSAAEIAAAPQNLLKLDKNGDGMLTPDELMERPQNAGASSDELSRELMSYDKDGKGYLVASDLPERLQRLFQRADTNHDGKLTREELKALSARQGMPNGPAIAPGRATGMFLLDPLLYSLDTNHDGVLSAEEIANASASLLTLDKNGDGEITADEMRVRQQTPEERADHMLEEWDTTRRGRISKAEAPERLASQFDQIDTNHDGFLDREELIAFFKKQAGSGSPR